MEPTRTSIHRDGWRGRCLSVAMTREIALRNRPLCVWKFREAFEINPPFDVIRILYIVHCRPRLIAPIAQLSMPLLPCNKIQPHASAQGSIYWNAWCVNVPNKLFWNVLECRMPETRWSRKKQQGDNAHLNSYFINNFQNIFIKYIYIIFIWQWKIVNEKLWHAFTNRIEMLG